MSRRRRGIALVVVLWTVALLATVTAMASSAARTSAAVASNSRAQAVARAMAESGIVAATSMMDDSLRAYRGDATRRSAYLNRLDRPNAATPARALVEDSLAEGAFAVAVVDVNARLDVNNAGADGLAMLFATVTSPGVARDMGARIDAAVRGDPFGRRDASDGSSTDADVAEMAQRASRDSLTAALLGRERASPYRRPFESLDELRALAGLDVRVLDAVAASLTVDGDGRINRQSASAVIRAAASGSLVDAPTRLLLVSRGWQRGHPLTREIQAVYDVSDDGVRLVRWRELDR
jgi:hypothetical protein